jgi:hypothetical protein
LSSNDTIRRFLLGMLDDTEHQRIEEHLISDRDFFEQVLIVEDELIDEYLDGSLSEKDEFRLHFLASAQQRRKLEVAHVIKALIGRSSSATGPDIPQLTKEQTVWWKRWKRMPAASVSVS